MFSSISRNPKDNLDSGLCSISWACVLQMVYYRWWRSWDPTVMLSNHQTPAVCYNTQLIMVNNVNQVLSWRTTRCLLYFSVSIRCYNTSQYVRCRSVCFVPVVHNFSCSYLQMPQPCELVPWAVPFQTAARGCQDSTETGNLKNPSGFTKLAAAGLVWARI